MQIPECKRAVAALCVVMMLAAVPAYDRVEAVRGANVALPASTTRQYIVDAAHPFLQRGTVRHVFAAAPLASSFDITSTATITPAATVTATVPATATIPVTPTATVTPTNTPSPTPPPTNTPVPTHTPRPTNTPRPTPAPLSVKIVSVGAYVVNGKQEQRLETVALGTPVRLKIVVSVAHASRGGLTVIAAWDLRTRAGKIVYHYQRYFLVHNGRTGLYDDIVVPGRNFNTGSYTVVGTIVYGRAVLRASSGLQVVEQGGTAGGTRVHYAHMRITVPKRWTLDFEKDSRGQPATGKDSLVMFSPSRLAAILALSGVLKSVPSAAELRANTPALLQLEFNGVHNIKTITIKSKIDGHPVYAAQGDVTVNGNTSSVLIIVTNKQRELYVFNVVNVVKHAPQSELRAGMTAIFGAKFD